VFGHGRALATGAWLIPFVIAAVFAMYRILDSIDGLAPLLHGILLVLVPLGLMVAAIWMARSIATQQPVKAQGSATSTVAPPHP
jgi:hypothetical protein